MATSSLLHAADILVSAFLPPLVVAMTGSPQDAPRTAFGSASTAVSVKEKLVHIGNAFILYWARLVDRGKRLSVTRSEFIKVAPVLIALVWLLRWRFRVSRIQAQSEDASPDVSDSIGIDSLATDPGLLKKHSQYSRVFVPMTGFTYPSIRIFYRPHPQADKLPSTPTPIPLLVFIHGLGGSIAQFHPLLASLVNVAPCLAVDLPGCGLSRFYPKDWKAYDSDALVHLLAVIIESFRDKERGQGVVLICHSMGTSLGALLASSTSPHAKLISQNVLGMVAICPVAEPPPEKQIPTIRKLLSIPNPIFDLWRKWDRRGGTESPSVYRFTGKEADLETRKLQVRFNEQSRTPVFRRMAYGTLPDCSSGKPKGGIPGEAAWAGIKVPLYLVAGEDDHVTPIDNALKISRFLGREDEHSRETMTVVSPTDVTSSALLQDETFSDTDSMSEGESLGSAGEFAASTSVTGAPSAVPFKVRILPSPASHALLYSTQTARPLSAHIQHFLSSAIDARLSLGWQLQHLTTTQKWDVKNLQKWRGVQNVSKPIAGVFRAMKTLREVDDEHAPKYFVEDWAPKAEGVKEEDHGEIKGRGRDGLGAIAAVVDISHESPVYDPQGLERGGIAYRKFPTVSKLPPTVDEVKHFIDLIDNLRSELISPLSSKNSSDQRTQSRDLETTTPLIAVHCHYGFNRTGFFIVCYLVERMNWRLRDAIREFGDKRPPGIRHAHFIDELWSRYWTREGGKRED